MFRPHDIGFIEILPRLTSSSIFFNRYPESHMLGSECDFKMYVLNLGYTFPYPTSKVCSITIAMHAHMHVARGIRGRCFV